jgi:hypothetical protein
VSPWTCRSATSSTCQLMRGAPEAPRIFPVRRHRLPGRLE